MGERCKDKTCILFLFYDKKWMVNLYGNWMVYLERKFSTINNVEILIE